MDAWLEKAFDYDNADPFRELKQKFMSPTKWATQGYFCGHSLGPMPKELDRALQHQISLWADLGVEGYFDTAVGWLSLHRSLCVLLESWVGAQVDEINIQGSLTTNLHLLLASFYQPTSTRNKILIEQQAFPSDRFVVESHASLHGIDKSVCIGIGENGLVQTQDWIDSIEQHKAQLAVVLIPAVQYLSGQRMDVAAITQAAQQYNIKVGVDCAHAIGNVPLYLHDWGVDFAVWCHYKYMNAGPGAPGGMFVHRKHHGTILPKLCGWWGQDSEQQFDMEASFKPQPDIQGWQLSCPPILSMMPLMTSLEQMATIDQSSYLQETQKLTGFFIEMFEQLCKKTILTPKAFSQRGAQISILWPTDVSGVVSALKQKGFYCDYRNPNVLRVACIPLLNSYAQMVQLIEVLSQIEGEQHAVA